MIPPSKMNQFRALQLEYFRDQGLQTITWHKRVRRISRRGTTNSSSFEDIPLTGLVQYNFFRTWPSLSNDIQGDFDNQNMVLIFHKDYLKENNYLNQHGNLDYTVGVDTFIIDGITYKDAGRTNVSQVLNSPIFEYIILTPNKVQNTKTPN